MAHNNTGDKPLKWWQLSLMGVACTIGTGYFLGTGVGIRIGGPAIIPAFLPDICRIRLIGSNDRGRSS